MLCYGTAGLAHIFNRLHQATRERVFRNAARAWLERTLELRRNGRGIAGFAALDTTPAGERIWVAEPGILMGAAGTGLALLAALTPRKPSWDRLFLLSA